MHPEGITYVSQVYHIVIDRKADMVNSPSACAEFRLHFDEVGVLAAGDFWELVNHEHATSLLYDES